jgi:hypothetical protein
MKNACPLCLQRRKETKITERQSLSYGSCDSAFVRSLSSAAPLPYDCIANALKTNVAVIPAETITCVGGT